MQLDVDWQKSWVVAAAAADSARLAALQLVAEPSPLDAVAYYAAAAEQSHYCPSWLEEARAFPERHHLQQWDMSWVSWLLVLGMVCWQPYQFAMEVETSWVVYASPLLLLRFVVLTWGCVVVVRESS